MHKHARKLILVVLILAILAGLNLTAFTGGRTEGSQFEVIVDNEKIEFTEELGFPYLTKSNRTMVPVRIISETMGYEVDWEHETQKVLISNGDKNIELEIGKSVASVNGKTVPIDVRDGKPADTKAELVPVKDSSRTYVPLRFVSETMGAGVEYENKEGIHHISINIKEKSLEVHFIDVGQGDSILIKQSGHNMLIDAGDNQYKDTVVDYLKKNNITKLDYVIGTHPHADHIGGLDAVINTFDVGKVMMPNVTHTTKTFENVLNAVKNKGLKITIPNVGDNYKLGNASFEIAAPNSDNYASLNDYSIVARMVFGKTSFLFTGDAEGISETEMLENDCNLKSDVLKVGHHGSDTSTGVSFLDTVNPKYAVIQVGEDNKYNHPTTEILDRLKERNITIYRNDLDGTIIAISNGENIKFNTKVGRDETGTDGKEENNSKPEHAKYIGNKNSKIFHTSTCNSLPMEDNRVYFHSIEDAISEGYKACMRCKP